MPTFTTPSDVGVIVKPLSVQAPDACCVVTDGMGLPVGVVTDGVGLPVGVVVEVGGSLSGEPSVEHAAAQHSSAAHAMAGNVRSSRMAFSSIAWLQRFED
ncbi:hypothetical protein ACLQ3C_16775 [Gordonia sp. DT30]|uniref:hypothetical protein n=1 Tax=unclassified Gordonia (in: high G+C Gram-positive bacteria) TaxID=2657482 RepID=UPI003CF2C7D2